MTLLLPANLRFGKGQLLNAVDGLRPEEICHVRSSYRGPSHFSRHQWMSSRSGMTAEIVHDQVDSCGCRVCQGQADRHLGELKARTIRCGKREMTTRFRLYRAEDIGCAATFVFIVPSSFSSRLDRRGGANIGVQGDRLLVQADYRLLRIIGLLIRLQHILHLGDVVVIEIGHHPHFFPATASGRG
jgi:hypothetical protein